MIELNSVFERSVHSQGQDVAIVILAAYSCFA
jgi:hypothetical protein